MARNGSATWASSAVESLIFRHLGRVAEPLLRLAVVREVHLRRVLEALGEEVRDSGIELHAAEVAVAAGGDHLQLIALRLQHRGVEGAAAEIHDRQPAPGQEPARGVRHRRGRRLIDQCLHREAGQHRGPPQRGALALGEMGGHPDDGAKQLRPEGLLGEVPSLAQDLTADLGERQLLPTDLRRHLVALVGDDPKRRPRGSRCLEPPPQPALGAGDDLAWLRDAQRLRSSADQ